MKSILLGLSWAATLILILAMSKMPGMAQTPGSPDPPTAAQQQAQVPEASEDPTQTPSTNPREQDPSDSASGQTAKHQNEAQMPAAGSQQSQDAKAFTGEILMQNGKVVLMDTVTKTSYKIDDASKVKSYMGKQVKVTGKLDMGSNTIHVANIEPLSTE